MAYSLGCHAKGNLILIYLSTFVTIVNYSHKNLYDINVSCLIRDLLRMSDDLHGVQISDWWSPLSLELNLLGPQQPVGWHKSPASFCSRLLSHLATSVAESCCRHYAQNGRIEI